MRKPQLVELIDNRLGLLWERAHALAAGGAGGVAHRPALVFEAVHECCEEPGYERRHGFLLHLVHQLRDARARRLAHGVVVRLRGFDVVVHNLGGASGHSESALVAHNQSPGLLRVQTHSLRYVVPVETHAREERGHARRLGVLVHSVEKGARGHGGCEPHLAPVVAQALGQPSRQLVQLRQQVAAAKDAAQGLHGEESGFAHEAVGVLQGAVDELALLGTHVRHHLHARAHDEALQSLKRRLQALPSFCVVSQAGALVPREADGGVAAQAARGHGPGLLQVLFRFAFKVGLYAVDEAPLQPQIDIRPTHLGQHSQQLPHRQPHTCFYIFKVMLTSF
mmetsp:Transcript_502/g.1069  ORF Transcript_502/g.1069 Transcript_502/m.1069 type:complete len:337 (+) Transcript_502:1071-2081(+)